MIYFIINWLCDEIELLSSLIIISINPYSRIGLLLNCSPFHGYKLFHDGLWEGLRLFLRVILGSVCNFLISKNLCFSVFEKL